MIFKARDKYFDLNKKPLIMGILNFTPDSFSDGGKFNHFDAALKQIDRMISEGADIIDIGGESSRPGAVHVSSERESARILPVIKAVKSRFDICLSVDTYKPEVAQAALDEGAEIINDVFGTDIDENMLKIVSRYSAGLCIMHIKGAPDNMQKDTYYDDIVSDIKSKLRQSVESAVKAGIKHESILIDPGIGFGKDIEGNLRLKNLEDFKDLNYPLLIGTSRKSFIGHILGEESENRLYGTISSNILALSKGAAVFRVHDVKENKQAIDLAYRILKS